MHYWKMLQFNTEINNAEFSLWEIDSTQYRVAREGSCLYIFLKKRLYRDGCSEDVLNLGDNLNTGELAQGMWNLMQWSKAVLKRMKRGISIQLLKWFKRDGDLWICTYELLKVAGCDDKALKFPTGSFSSLILVRKICHSGE